MILETYNKTEKDKSFYKKVDVSDLIIEGEYLTLHSDDSYGDIYITETMKDSLCKFVGLSSSINKCLYDNDKDLWYKVITKLYKYHNESSIIMLVSQSEDGKYYVKGLCNSPRELIVNDKFIDSVISYYEPYNKELLISDVGYSKNVTSSHVLVTFNNDYLDTIRNEKFQLGVVIRNDELNGTYCRMAIRYIGGPVYYLPSKYYNLSTSRYVKRTESSIEALNLILLRIYEDYSSGLFEDKLNIIMSLISSTKDKYISRMEYEQVKSVISKASALSNIDEKEYNEIMSDLDSCDDFEELYGDIESDYLWKCTAIGGTTLYKLITVVSGILREHCYYPEDENLIRDLLGEYLALPRVCQVLAKKV